MWFMNKLVNPILSLLLRSPLHGLAGSALLLLTYRGRKSGKEYSLPVQYAREGNTIYILPAMPERKIWWRNLRGGAPVKVTLGGKTMAGKGRTLESADTTGTKPAALAVYLKRFPALARMLHIQVGADGSFHSKDLRQAANKVVLVRINLDNE